MLDKKSLAFYLDPLKFNKKMKFLNESLVHKGFQNLNSEKTSKYSPCLVLHMDLELDSIVAN